MWDVEVFRRYTSSLHGERLLVLGCANFWSGYANFLMKHQFGWFIQALDLNVNQTVSKSPLGYDPRASSVRP
jgi:hypothetical protein